MRETSQDVNLQAGVGEADASPTFSFEHVSLSFGANEVLSDICLDIPKGQKLVVIGPSGAGKTTALRLMSGVLWPSAGSIHAFGQDTSSLNGRALKVFKQRVGIIHQNDNLVPSLRVVHNVLMGRLHQWPLLRSLLSLLWPQEINSARDALRDVELEEKLWALPDELSGGQQQRVAIARLILQQPDALLADEPVSQLDIRLGREVVALLSKLADQSSASLVVNLHSLDLLDEHFDRVIALRDGKLFWDGTPGQLSASMLHELYGAEYRALDLDEFLASRG